MFDCLYFRLHTIFTYLSRAMNYETVPFIIPALAAVYLVTVYLLLMFVQRSRA
jgi:hypothetical protein